MLRSHRRLVWVTMGSIVILIGITLSYWLLPDLWQSSSIVVEPTIEEMVPGRYRMLPHKDFPGFTFELLPNGVYRAHIDDPSYDTVFPDWTGKWRLMENHSAGKTVFAVTVTQWPDLPDCYRSTEHKDTWYMEVKRSDLTRITPDQRIWGTEPCVPPFSRYAE